MLLVHESNSREFSKNHTKSSLRGLCLHIRLLEVPEDLLGEAPMSLSQVSKVCLSDLRKVKATSLQARAQNCIGKKSLLEAGNY